MRRYRRRSKGGLVVVVDTVGQRQQVVEASDAAMSGGVRRGMSLAEARILCPRIECIEHDPAGDHRALEALGRWMTRFTPIVSVGWALEKNEEDDVPAVLFLDLTGCQRFFHGTGNLFKRVGEVLERFGIPAWLAVAPTLGAAWALSFAGRRIVEGDDLIDHLSPLPLETLRLSAGTIDALHSLGLQTIGQLLALPRDQMPARFGAKVLTRIDQALGVRQELLIGLEYQVPVAARMELESPIDSLQTVWSIMEKLLSIVVDDLLRRGRGARQLELVFESDPALDLRRRRSALRCRGRAGIRRCCSICLRRDGADAMRCRLGSFSAEGSGA